jgi:hypothetical protein
MSIRFDSNGGIFYFSDINSSQFILDRCIFSKSIGGHQGGVFCNNGFIPFIQISRCLFKNNNFIIGLDIVIVISQNWNGNENALYSSIDSFTCSTSTPSDNRVVYNGTNRTDFLHRNCTDIIV